MSLKSLGLSLPRQQQVGIKIQPIPRQLGFKMIISYDPQCYKLAGKKKRLPAPAERLEKGKKKRTGGTHTDCLVRGQRLMVQPGYNLGRG